MSGSRLPRILIVDDERQIRDAVTSWFYQRGFFVREAENGKRAVELCMTEEFDAVLIDMEMPVMRGPEAIAAIRKAHPNLPIVVFTGFSEETDSVVKAGASLVLQKPLGMRELEAKVRQLLHQGDPSGQRIQQDLPPSTPGTAAV